MPREETGIVCPYCGLEGRTTAEYVRGPKAYCCAVWMFNLTAVLGFLCLAGVGPGRNFWDVNHHCSNCGRKGGFQDQAEDLVYSLFSVPLVYI
jgi:DNA-directed RNA polymerase subunit RPC12/RpoP